MMNKFEISGFFVTGDSKIYNELYGITPEIQSILQTMQHKVVIGNINAPFEIQRLIEKYPHIPQFMNLLVVLYGKQGNNKKARELNNYILKEHPQYLFGKLNLANEYIFKKQFERVPEILGELMDIKALYPERNEFHISEVSSFIQTAINYFIGIEDMEAAEVRLDILEKLNEKFNIVPDAEIEKIKHSILSLRMEIGLERYLKQTEKTRNVEVIATEVIKPSIIKPHFSNALIDQLYCNSLRINHDILKEILLLPRESLINDLHKVVYDSIARFDYLANETEWSPETHEFLNHAICLLTELKSEESLDVLLDILRQDEDYIDYWFSDSLSDILWELLFIAGNNKLDKFKSYLFEPNHSNYNRSVISETVVQIALLQPTRREEVIQWYKEIIEEILSRKDDETIIDSDWIGFMVSDLLDIRAVELSDLIKQLFDNELVSEFFSGDYEAVANEFKSGKDYSFVKRKIYDNIFLKYEHIVASWHYYNPKEKINHKNSRDKDDLDFSGNQINMEKVMPVANHNKIIGRNDPCPCGSGKKYKKCCMNLKKE